MRLWSLHPKYLDAKGLVALWREALLAKHVLEGKTKGYKNHPQLERFRSSLNSSDCINNFLSEIYEEAKNRGYNFSEDKINWNFKHVKLPVTVGQIEYEKQHLLKKLKVRDECKFENLRICKLPDIHPIFNRVEGKIEKWERF